MKQLIERKLKQLQSQGLYRARVLSSVQQGDELNFCSNDYLSLSQHPALKSAYQEGFLRYPCGSSGSALLSGYHEVHRNLEQQVATTLGVDDALIFSSGYAANLAVVGLLASLGVHLILDKAMHASVYDGLTLSQASYSRYRHGDLAHLEQQLKRAPQPAMVMTEGLFSMSGQFAALDAIIALCRRYDATCYVDEAHSFGLVGQQGLGLTHAHGLSQDDVPLRLLTFGKALAGQGAIIAGERTWIDALVQHARSYIYSTALSPALAYGMMTAFELVQGACDERERLKILIRYFQQLQQEASVPRMNQWRSSNSPIQQLQLGCPHRAKQLAEHLRMQGIFCQAIRQPTVTLQETGLRIVLNASHTQADLNTLLQTISQGLVMKEDGYRQHF